MAENKEESMVIGTQSQSQMDTSNSQDTLKRDDAQTDKTKCWEQDPINLEETDELCFPSSLEGFSYKFNDEGQLRHVETDEPFVFKIRSHDHEYNQLRYEALGEVITNYVYELLEKEAELKRVMIPIDAKEEEAQSFIFMSEDALTNPDKLLLLIHGSGVVRAGQWARRLIINDCLDRGTQLPFIKRAVEAGYGVIVLNTNANRVRQGNKVMPVKGSVTAVEHGLYVWDNFVSKAAAKHLAIIAHSYGGVVTVEMAVEKEEEFKKRVFAVAMTDSVHSMTHQEVSSSLIKHFKKVCQNWVSSKEPLDTPVPSRHRHECPQVSAGTNKHEETSWYSFDSIFKMLTEKFKSVSGADRQEL